MGKLLVFVTYKALFLKVRNLQFRSFCQLLALHSAFRSLSSQFLDFEFYKFDKFFFINKSFA